MNIPVMNSPLLKQVAEGKTKVIMQVVAAPTFCQVISLDRISAGDGRRKDEIPGKGVLANCMTCDVFRYLQRQGVPLAFVQQLGDDAFLAELCDMIPLEVVVRFKARGSKLKRDPDIPKDAVFSPPLVEFFLKTSGRRWRGTELPCDDPYLVIKDSSPGEFIAYRPDQSVYEVGRAAVLESVPFSDVGVTQDDLEEMASIAAGVGTALKMAFAEQGGDFIDMKIEFGRSRVDGRLVVGDVIDNDSWRIVWNGADRSKEGYRQGDSVETTLANYQFVARITRGFNYNPS